MNDQELRDKIRIKKLIKLGHSHQCAYRQVWGVGDCNCRRKNDGKADRTTGLPKTGKTD